MRNNSKSLFDQIGIAGAGVILILVGIVFAVSQITSSNWAWLCILLGISFVAFAGAKESHDTLQIVASVISGGCFVASIIILLTSLH